MKKLGYPHGLENTTYLADRTVYVLPKKQRTKCEIQRQIESDKCTYDNGPECFTQKGADYKGMTSKTVSGLTCRSWSDKIKSDGGNGFYTGSFEDATKALDTASKARDAVLADRYHSSSAEDAANAVVQEVGHSRRLRRTPA